MRKVWLFAALVICSLDSIAAGKTKLDRLLTAEMLGVQRDYFEQISGIAKRVSGNYREYDIGGCIVSITEDKQRSISSIALANLSPRCTFDASKIYLDGPAHKLTFNKLNEMNIGGGARESCFGLCGNAIEPDYGLDVQTPHVMNFIEYSASVGYSKESAPAVESLQAKLQKRFPGVELYGDYLGTKIPKKIYNEMWMKEFGNVRINSIQFGHQIVNN